MGEEKEALCAYLHQIRQNFITSYCTSHSIYVVFSPKLKLIFLHREDTPNLLIILVVLFYTIFSCKLLFKRWSNCTQHF